MNNLKRSIQLKEKYIHKCEAKGMLDATDNANICLLNSIIDYHREKERPDNFIRTYELPSQKLALLNWSVKLMMKRIIGDMPQPLPLWKEWANTFLMFSYFKHKRHV